MAKYFRQGIAAGEFPVFFIKHLILYPTMNTEKKYREYRMTYVARILATIIFVPVGALLFLIIFTDKLDAASVAVLAVSGGALFFLTMLFWLYGARLKVLISATKIQRRSLFGTTTLRLDENTRISAFAIGAQGAAAFGLVGGLAAGVVAAVAEKGASINYYVTIEENGKRIKLNSNIKGIHRLLAELQAFEDRVIVPACRAKLKNGESVEFGKLKLDKQFLASGKAVTLVSDIGSVAPGDFKGRTLKLKLRGKLFSPIKVDLRSTPNIRTLLSLMDEMRRLK